MKPAGRTLKAFSAKADAEVREWLRQNGRLLPPEELRGGLSDPAKRHVDKKATDREREKFRARKSRARVERDPDGRVIVPGETHWKPPESPDGEPPTRQLERLLTKDYVLPDVAHAERVQRLQLVLHEALKGFDPSSFPGELGAALAPHAGKISRAAFERVRGMYEATGLVASRDEWKRRLRIALRNALRDRHDDKHVKEWNSDQIELLGVPCGSSGVTIRKWLEVQGHVPPTLTAARIQAALQRSTLGRGGTKKKLVNWETALEELIRLADPHSSATPGECAPPEGRGDKSQRG